MTSDKAQSKLDKKLEAQQRALEEQRANEERRAKERAERIAEQVALEAQRKKRREERKRQLEPDPTIDERIRQASNRVYFMKTNRDKVYELGDPEYDMVRRAENYLSKLKYQEKKRKKFDQLGLIAASLGQIADAQKHMDESEEYLKAELYTLYIIGVLHGKFVLGTGVYEDD